ncbi:hypothetical protein K2173_008041 [Erythroxylum novogranatense]|uniref:Uncharacterized protein n=1 Tax=Erythroxylum novogranatense TaxID=1862640 RepID=A0AAV8T7D3_9ROSI|nr:hypothetical protein K2173_008041 [Erythroxylum novogranatense]
MLKPSPSRNQRSKGFKVKHVLQIFLLLAIAVWMLYQCKHSYDEKEGVKDSSEKISEEVQGENDILKLGRKGLRPREERDLNFESESEKEELEEETEDIKSEEIEEEGRGGGDDEIDGHDQERADEEGPEEIEDLIDVDDGEKDGSSEQGNESLVDRAHFAGERSFQEFREERFKSYDIYSDVNEETEISSNKSEIGTIRNVKVNEMEDDHNINKEQGNKSRSSWDSSVEVIDLGLQIRNRVNENSDRGINASGKEAHDESSSSIPDSFRNKELKTNTQAIPEESLQDGNGKGVSSIHRDEIAEEKQIDMQAVPGVQNGSSDGTLENAQTYRRSTLLGKNESLDAIGIDSVVSAAAKLDATAASGGSSKFTTISKNVDALHSGDSVSFQTETTDNSKAASL